MSLGSVTRGCGKRQKGAIYGECKLGVGGRPVEDFIIDPPAKVDAQALGLSSVGVKLVQTNGVWNVLDIIGGDSYPNVADFVEEVRRFGLSRRLPRTLDFSKLTAESRMILLHRRAYIENFRDYQEALGDEGWACPKANSHHISVGDEQMCAGLWWEDIDGGELIPGEGFKVLRRLPGFEYTAWQRPDAVTPSYSLAIFMAVPIHNLAVIRDADGGSDEEAMQCASRSSLEIHLEDE